jgi:uncharacterized protein
MQSYNYANRYGIEEISWERFATLSAQLSESLAPAGVEIVIGIARAGLFPATSVACALRRELYPVRVTRRLDDEVTFARPVWRVGVPEAVAGKVVAVVDEIADTGETLALVAEAAHAQGAESVVTATLVSHTWANPMPDIVALVSDALVLFPWDRQVYIEGEWQPHPEVTAAIEAQKKSADNQEE